MRIVILLLFALSIASQCPKQWPLLSSTKSTVPSLALKETWHSYVHQHRLDLTGNQTRLFIIKLSTSLGWGNRIPSIVTGALLALLTNRTLAVTLDSVPGQHGYFDVDEFLHFCFPRHHLHHNYHRNAEMEAQVTWQQLLETNWQSIEEREGGPAILTYWNHNYQIPLLQSNPHLTAFFNSNFPSGEVFSSFWHLIFQPSAALTASIQKALPVSHGPHHRSMIGIQIRLVKGSFGGFVRFDMQRFFMLALALARSRGHHELENVVFFIAGDTPIVYQAAVAALGANRTLWTDNQIGEHHQGASNPGTEMSGLTDLLILSTCSDIIVSFSSSFGAIASAISGRKPLYVFPETRQLRRAVNYPLYFRALTSEPCMFGAREFLDLGSDPQRKAVQGNPYFYQHLQCHWTSDPFGRVYFPSRKRSFFSKVLRFFISKFSLDNVQWLVWWADGLDLDPSLP